MSMISMEFREIVGKTKGIKRIINFFEPVVFRIGHDNKGGFAGWMLDRVEIEAPSLDNKLYFPCGRWLDKDEEDGLIERELTPLERMF